MNSTRPWAAWAHAVPLFEFKCAQCGHTVERLQKHDDPAPKCEKDAETMQRQIGRTSFRLLGGGWASDGYK